MWSTISNQLQGCRLAIVLEVVTYGNVPCISTVWRSSSGCSGCSPPIVASPVDFLIRQHVQRAHPTWSSSFCTRRCSELIPRWALAYQGHCMLCEDTLRLVGTWSDKCWFTKATGVKKGSYRAPLSRPCSLNFSKQCRCDKHPNAGAGGKGGLYAC
jgi:hypothetical protein